MSNIPKPSPVKVPIMKGPNQNQSRQHHLLPLPPIEKKEKVDIKMKSEIEELKKQRLREIVALTGGNDSFDIFGNDFQDTDFLSLTQTPINSEPASPRKENDSNLNLEKAFLTIQSLEVDLAAEKEKSQHLEKLLNDEKSSNGELQAMLQQKEIQEISLRNIIIQKDEEISKLRSQISKLRQKQLPPPISLPNSSDKLLKKSPKNQSESKFELNEDSNQSNDSFSNNQAQQNTKIGDKKLTEDVKPKSEESTPKKKVSKIPELRYKHLYSKSPQSDSKIQRPKTAIDKIEHQESHENSRIPRTPISGKRNISP